MTQTILSVIIIFTLISGKVSSSQEMVSAFYYHQRADSIASTLLTVPQLIIIRSDSVDTLGRSICWCYYYQKLKISISYDSVVCDSVLGHLTGSAEINIQRCINSDSAINIAEINGGKEFRGVCSDYSVKCNLGHDSALPWEEWDITYASKNMPSKKLVFVINAQTGEIFYQYKTGIKSSDSPSEYSLLQNFPNPFNLATTIEYSISKSTFVNLTVYDINCRTVDVLVNSYHAPGSYKIRWNTNILPSGAYFYRLKTDDSQFTKKLQIIR
jgi:hypothetical protein